MPTALIPAWQLNTKFDRMLERVLDRVQHSRTNDAPGRRRSQVQSMAQAYDSDADERRAPTSLGNLEDIAEDGDASQASSRGRPGSGRRRLFNRLR